MPAPGDPITYQTISRSLVQGNSEYSRGFRIQWQISQTQTTGNISITCYTARDPSQDATDGAPDAADANYSANFERSLPLNELDPNSDPDLAWTAARDLLELEINRQRGLVPRPAPATP